MTNETELTNQTAFNKVATHLFTQGKQAMSYSDVDKQDMCMYRGEKGTSCAVGCLIPDQDYDTTFEGKAACGIIERVKLLKNLDVRLLEQLQRCHDDSENWESTRKMKYTLGCIATQHSLDHDILNGLSLPIKIKY